MDVHCASWGFEMLGEGEGVVTLWAAKRLYEQKASLLNGRANVFWGHQLVYMSSCIVCKQRISLPSVWACVSWGSQPVCRRSCTVCKQQASLQCELDRPQSLFYFVLQEISQPSRIGFCACVFSVWKHWWLSSRTGCSCGTSFNHAESCAFWDLLSSWRRDHTEDMSKVCLQFVFQFPWLVLRSGVAMVLLNQSGS